MKEQATVVDTFLSKSLEYLNSAEAFLKAEVPSYVQELLAWEFYSSVSLAIFALLILISCAYTIYLVFRDIIEEGYSIVAVVVGIVFSFVLLCSAMDAVKVKVAPRVYLVEKISSMMQK